MRLIYQPEVILVAQSKLTHSIELDNVTDNFDAQYIDDFGTPTVSDLDALPELAGRLCYHSFAKPRPGGNHGYLGHILKEGHGSVLEHSYVTFLFTGVSRSLTHELIRHRAGTGFSELSQRYYEPDQNDVGFVVPPLAVGNSDLEIELSASYKAAWDRYNTVLALTTQEAAKMLAGRLPALKGTQRQTMINKRAREAARAVLPNAIETRILMSGNLRAWRNVIEQRGSVMADLEMRRLVQLIASKLMIISPQVFQDTTVRIDFTDMGDGHAEVINLYRKV